MSSGSTDGRVPGSVKSAERALEVLELLTARPRGMTYTDIRAALDLPKSSAHGLLATMVTRGFLHLDTESRVYTLGLRVWEAGQAYLAAAELERVALPYLEAVRDQLNETVQLSVLDGVENVYIAKVDADQQLVLASRVGARLPAYATGLGKALLSGLDDREVRTRFAGHEFRRFTPTTVRDVDALLRDLEVVRAQGYATDRAEYTPGVFCVAVPVRDHTGRISAAMSVSAPEVRTSESGTRQLIAALTRQAQALSTRLGHPDELSRLRAQ